MPGDSAPEVAAVDNSAAFLDALAAHAAVLRRIESAGVDAEHEVELWEQRDRLSFVLAEQAIQYSRWQFQLTGNSFPFGFVDNDGWEPDDEFDDDDDDDDDDDAAIGAGTHVAVSTLAVYEVESLDELLVAAQAHADCHGSFGSEAEQDRNSVAHAVAYAVLQPVRLAGLRRCNLDVAVRTLGGDDKIEWTEGDADIQGLEPDFCLYER